MKKIFFVTFALAVVLAGCKNEADFLDGRSADGADAGRKAYVSIAFDDGDGRTVLPVPFAKQDLSYVLNGKAPSASSFSRYGSWDSYADMMSMDKIDLSPIGSWTFRLDAYKNGSVVLTGTETKNIAYGYNTLNFVLDEAATGKGNLNVSLKYPKTGISKVTAGLFDLNGNALAGYGASILSPSVQGDMNVVTYSKSAVNKGTYILRFYLYQKNSDVAFTNCYSVVVHIAPGSNTTGSEVIENVNSVYPIEYELNGGEWGETYVPLTYTSYTLVELPKNVCKEDAVFAGWYETSDFLSERIYSIPYGQNGSKKYYAKWVDEITCTASEFVTIFEGLNSGSAKVHITDASPNLNHLKTGLKNTSVNVRLDLSQCGNLTVLSNSIFKGMSNLTEITLPDSMVGIGDYAFENSALERIAIPDSLTEIGTAAFSSCHSLGEVDFGNSLQSIGYRAFYDCGKLKNISIPDSVVTIDVETFKNCSELETVTLGSGVNQMAESVFANCGKLHDVSLPANLSDLGDRAFSGCKALPSVALPDSLVKIGKYAFENCRSMTEMTIPENVYAIGEGAFCNCIGIDSVIIPDSVVEVGNRIFYGCGNISITVGNALLNSYLPSESMANCHNAIFEGCSDFALKIICTDEDIGDRMFYDCQQLKSVEISDGISEIGDFAFYGCSELSDITLPSDLETIGNHAFELCASLDDISLPTTLTGMGDYALSGCAGLSQIVIPANVKNLGDFVFKDCSGIRVCDLPSGLLTVGKNAFENCVKLSSVVLPDTMTSIGEAAFSGIDGLDITLKSSLVAQHKSLDSVPLTTGYSYLKCNKLFAGLKNFTVNLSSASTEIGEYSFNLCMELKSISIPDSVTEIGQYAFRACTGMTGIILPNTITVLGEGVFQLCTSLVSINIPSIDIIPKLMFDCCSRITSMEIPDGVASIGESAFCKCLALESITIPSSVTSIGNGAFTDCRKLENIEIPCGVASIEKNIFNGCSALTSVLIPDGVTSIGEGAFSGCAGLESIEIPDSVTSIGKRAFYGCSNLVFMIPLGITAIPVGASVSYANGGSYWFGDTGPREIRFAEGSAISSIPDYAFCGCVNSTSIEILDSVTSIGKNAFYGCSNLVFEIPSGVFIPAGDSSNGSYWFGKTGPKEIRFAEGSAISSIPDYAFYGCSNLTDMEIPNSVTNIGRDAFYGCSNLVFTIPLGITTIPAGDTYTSGSYWFGDTGPKEIKFAKGSAISSIPDYAFYRCVNLTRIEIPNGVSYIRERAFSSCKNLTSIILPAGLWSIGDYAFSFCEKLSKLNFLGTKSKWSNVSKGAGWYSSSGLREVICSDGLGSL